LNKLKNYRVNPESNTVRYMCPSDEEKKKQEEEEIRIKIPKVRIEAESEDEKDIEELREVLKAISDFIESLKKPLEELLTMVMEQLKGEVLGKDVAEFYKSLIDAGMDKKIVEEMTKSYFDERLKAANVIGTLVESLGKWKGFKSEELAEKLKELKKLKEAPPSKEKEEEEEGGGKEE